MTVAYVDASALVTVAFNERGRAVLVRRLRSFSTPMSSNLLEAELRAVCSREGAGFAEAILEGIDWILPDRSLAPEIATVLEAGYLRGADLWHVASALYSVRKPE